MLINLNYSTTFYFKQFVISVTKSLKPYFLGPNTIRVVYDKAQVGGFPLVIKVS